MASSPRINAGGWLAQAKSRLKGSDNPGLEAQLLLAHVLKQPRAQVLAHLDQELSGAQAVLLAEMLARLEGGVPLAYILGEAEFYGISFTVNPAVLIPRPETELLVEEAYAWLRDHPDRRMAADVGTGSGCIAAVLAARVPDLRLLAVDRSRAALDTARGNFARLGLADRVLLTQSDLLSCCGAALDLVCANLPYIPSGTLHGLAVALHEPALALDGGADGLALIARLLRDAPRWTAPGGMLLLEIEAGQGESAPELARQSFAAAEIEVKLDLAGHPRLLKIQL